MSPNQNTPIGEKPDRNPIVTIDDCTHLAQELAGALHRLGEYKHPLALRKGQGKTNPATPHQILKAGSKTYFFDVKQAKDGRPYLTITENRPGADGKGNKRISLIVFPEHAQEFVEMAAGIATQLS
jgi:Protein of unknown function (DUF3276)